VTASHTGTCSLPFPAFARPGRGISLIMMPFQAPRGCCIFRFPGLMVLLLAE
jgi:hypothetical protein